MMGIPRHKRQVFLFLAAILLPALVLTGLAGRMIFQERELAASRSIAQRRNAVEQLRRELSARLDAIRLQEIVDAGHNPAVIVTATVDGDHLVLPWQVPPPEETPAFASHREAGETAEFAKNDYAAAVAAYRQALASAANPTESAEGRLFLARALSKSGKTEDAIRIYQELLKAPADARDDQGVGYRFYAFDRLVAAGQHPAVPDAIASMTLPELYLVGGKQTLTRIAELEQAVALAKDFPRLHIGTAWVPYGQWLVTLASPQLLLAVSSASVSPPGIKLGTRKTDDRLGDSFPGLYAEWADPRALEALETRLPVGVWLAGLAMVLGAALFGGYLLLRDVNRDVRLTEVRSQFVASVSHELKTPLTAIRMFAETLAMGRSRDEITKAEYLETIVNESERLTRLVDNVLDFSKIEQGKKIYRLRPASLDAVADSAVRAMQFPLAQQGFRLRVSVDKNLPTLPLDPDAIEQAILNLIANAMKYSGASRDIELRVAAQDGNAVIEVADHGLGLEPEEKKHVFDKFYRAPSHASHAIAGAGLGLTLVAHIAAAHGGRAEVESESGAGSRFRILIPESEAHA